MGAGLAVAWLAAHRGGCRGSTFALAHVVTLLLDPLANASCRLLVALWAGCSAAITGNWTMLLLVGVDAASLAAIGAAIFEPAFLYLAQRKRARAVHLAWVGIADACSCALGWCLPCSIATATEWFLLGDLLLQRIYHVLHPCTREGDKSILHGKGNAKILAIIIHGTCRLCLIFLEQFMHHIASDHSATAVFRALGGTVSSLIPGACV